MCECKFEFSMLAVIISHAWWKIFVAFSLNLVFRILHGPPLPIILAFIADFCNFLSLFFIMNCSLKFLGISFFSLLEAMWMKINWKKIFWMGAAGDAFTRRKFHCYCSRYHAELSKKQKKWKNEESWMNFLENNEIRIRKSGGGSIHLILNKDINETGAGWKNGTSN